MHYIQQLFLTFFVTILLASSPPKYQKLPRGVLIRLNKSRSHGTKAVKLQVVSNKIIHVTASPTKQFHHETNLMLVKNYQKQVSWHITRKNNQLTLHTDSLQAEVSLNTGRITFRNAMGRVILREAADGRTFSKAKIDSSKASFYHIRQVFDSPKNEAFYGLGEHQKRFLNLKGRDVTLAQHNTEAAIPFLLSSRNYGLLWDNYSITRFGDPKPYQELSGAGLKLFDKEGHRGGLTATYMNKKDTTQVYEKRNESQIDYQYLSKLKNLPAGFQGKQMTNGEVVWQGKISSKYNGMHKFALTSAGRVKLWIDGQLRVDRWRQAWNPVTSKINVNLQKGEKVPIRLEWTPDGGQSFIALKWRKPMPQLDKHRLSLYSQVARQINYFFVFGHDMDDVIGGYRQLTGKTPIMPKWAMGFWQSREHYNSQKQILSVAHKFRQQNIPIDNIVQDWYYWKKNKWGSQRFDSTRYP
ncbi:MAG TPA: TIM-barrel domain-containing protein, partial [Balneolaceae bacterium]|nr:TIM-barrel domain-containing protein [Balneolaceae bacterium]